MMNATKHLFTLFDNVCDPARPGRSGHSDIIWEVSERLLEAGCRVDVVADYTAAQPFEHENLRVRHFAPRPFDRRNGLGKMRHVLRAYRRADRAQTSLFFTTDAFSAGITALLSRRVPVVFLTPANILQRQASGFKLDPFAAAAYRLVSHAAARRSRHIIATSHDLRGWWLKTGADAGRLSVIPLGLDAALFAGAGRPAGRTLRLLYVARFEGDNNPRLLVALAQRLRDARVPFTLDAVGAGSLLELVKAEAARAGLGDVLRFHGHVDYRDLPAFYAGSDVFVFVREAGGPPRVVMQAMASGLAVVAFNGAGLEDYLEPGVSGFLVPNGDVGALAEQIAALSRDRAQLGRVQAAARDHVQTAYDWRAITARYLELFDELLEPPRPNPHDLQHDLQRERKAAHG